MPKPMLGYCRSGARAGSLYATLIASKAPMSAQGLSSRSLTGAGATIAQTLTSDLVAAVIVTIMLIPQSLAYALLAGLPPEVGLYASVLPLVAYAIFGTSSALAVGPVAVVSLMTAAAVGRIAAEGTADYASAAIVLALLSGVMLTLMGLFRLGFIANFLSHPVISGFITASGIIIATSQVGGLLGIRTEGHAMPDLVMSIVANIGAINLVYRRRGRGGSGAAAVDPPRPQELAQPLRRAQGRRHDHRAGRPGAWWSSSPWRCRSLFDLGGKGVALVGEVPQGLPMLSLPSFNLDTIQALLRAGADHLDRRLCRIHLGGADPGRQAPRAHRRPTRNSSGWAPPISRPPSAAAIR